MTITIEKLRELATEAGHYIDSEVHDFISYVESVFAPAAPAAVEDVAPVSAAEATDAPAV